MPTQINIKVDTRNLQKALEHYGPVQMRARLTLALTTSLKMLKAEVQANTPVYTHQAVSSIKYESVTKSATTFSGRVYSQSIVVDILESGRRPGARMPPYQNLQAWTEDKLGYSHLAYIVARSIGANGIAARNMFAKAVQKLEPAVRQLFEAAVRI